MTETPFTPDELRLLDETEAALARSLREVEPSPALLARVRSDFESRPSWTPWPAVSGWRVALVTATVAALAVVAVGLIPARRPTGAAPSVSSSASATAMPPHLEADAVTPAASIAPASSVAPASAAIASSPRPLRAPTHSLPRKTPTLAPRFEVLVPAARAAEQEAALWQLAALAAEGGTSPRALYEAGEPTRDLTEPVLPEIVPVFALDTRSDS